MRKRTIRHLGYKCIGPTITIARIKKFQKDLKNKKFGDWQELFKIFSGETRLKIVWLLSYEKELCVCDMADILKMSISAISHQLKNLRQLKIVKIRKDAQTIYYSLNKGRPNIYKLLKDVENYD
jgi:DNA-binding transcriptional ArsR family regulator